MSVLPQKAAVITYRNRRSLSGVKRTKSSGKRTYVAAPDVTRHRLYIETLRDVLARANKVIIDQGAKGGQGVVPYLPLNELRRNRPTSNGGQ